METKRIMLIAHFCDYGAEQSNNRFNYLANLWAEQGYRVELVTSSFSHRDKKQRKVCADETPYRTTLISEPSYHKNVSLKRLFYSHRVMGRNLSQYLKKADKPDVIYCAVPSLDAAYAAARYAKKHGVKFIIDVQDLWPEAFQMVLPISVVGKILFYPWKRKADKIYAAANEVVAVSQTYGDRAMKVNKKCKAPHVVYLGTDLDTFDAFVQGDVPFQKEDGKLYLGYCGTLGASYDIPCVLSALEILKNRGEEAPRFVVLGDGPQKANFEAMAKEKDLDVLFTGRLPYNEMCRYLVACDMLVNPIVRGAAQSIINKHADYAATGKAVVNTQECPEYRTLVAQYDCGLNCSVGSAEEMANAIKTLMKDASLRTRMGQNARAMAEELFHRKKTYGRVESLLERETAKV